jgi:hypothetical protein
LRTKKRNLAIAKTKTAFTMVEMSEPEQYISLNLNAPASDQSASGENLPAAETLQFRRAEHTASEVGGQRCAACAKPLDTTYFQVHDRVVCPECASSIESRQKAPPAHSLLRAFIYGLGAAIAGCALYATVAIVTGLEIALIAILIGYMVGKAIRHASGGLGGRPQQILAVVLTYFSISTSYIPVAIYQYAKSPQNTAVTRSANAEQSEGRSEPSSAGAALLGMLAFGLAAPFLSISGVGGLISLLIIFFGLQRAWRVTGRPEILVHGPFQTSSSS